MADQGVGESGPGDEMKGLQQNNRESEKPEPLGESQPKSEKVKDAVPGSSTSTSSNGPKRNKSFRMSTGAPSRRPVSVKGMRRPISVCARFHELRAIYDELRRGVAEQQTTEEKPDEEAVGVVRPYRNASHMFVYKPGSSRPFQCGCGKKFTTEMVINASVSSLRCPFKEDLTKILRPTSTDSIHRKAPPVLIY